MFDQHDMVPLPILDRTRDMFLDQKHVAKFKCVSIQSGELCTKGGATMYIMSSLVPDMSLFYARDLAVKTKLLRVFPLYMDQIIKIGYVCVVRKGLLVTTNHCMGVHVNNKMDDFEVKDVFDLMMVEDVKQRSCILLAKSTRI